MTDPATILLTIAPELSGVDATAAIAIAEMQIAASLCGDKRPLLVAYLAAHILTVAGRSGSSGAVTSLKEGNLAITYGATDAMGGLGATSYGVEYDRISRACVWSARTRVTHA